MTNHFKSACMCQCANITKNCSVDSLVILVRVYILSSTETFAQYFWNKSRCIFVVPIPSGATILQELFGKNQVHDLPHKFYI